MQLTRPPELEFEFICHYHDGSCLYQNYGTNQEKNFGDIDQQKLVIFELTNGEDSFSVNLKNGSFNLNGQQVNFDLGYLNGQRLQPSQLRLIYFRRIRENFGGDFKITVQYGLGWQCTIDGENYQRIVLVNPDLSLTLLNKK